MLKARYKKYTFYFKTPAGTSRGVLTSKDSWFIILYNEHDPEKIGIGECSVIQGLSMDATPDYEQKLAEVCQLISNGNLISGIDLNEIPSIQFGLEMAMADLNSKTPGELFPSEFTKGYTGIPINGLIWMGTYDFMYKQIVEKLNHGFRCIKIKIGAIGFNDELRLIKKLRGSFSEESLEIRVDANGAFKPKQALHYLKRLAKHKIHSIEQPVKQGQLETLKEICQKSPVPIALDEELIGVYTIEDKQELLDFVKPNYVVLKPSLTGGYKKSEEWIAIAEELGIDWWITSALESNIGLNAIAQWTFSLNKQVYHGLGTGEIYKNNIRSPLYLRDNKLFYDPDKKWQNVKD